MGGFNGSGTYVRFESWATDKSNSVDVTASRMDTEHDGFATGLSTAICKDGQTTTTAAIPFAVGITVNDGSVGTPAVAFINETDSGLYRIGTRDLGLAINGARVMEWTTATASVAGSLVLGSPLLAASGGTGDTGTAWASYTATCTASTGAITTATTTANQKAIGKQQYFRASCVISNAGTGAADLSIDLPATANSSGIVIAADTTNTNAGYGVISAASNKVKVVKYTGATIIGNATIVVSGVYEKQ